MTKVANFNTCSFLPFLENVEVFPIKRREGGADGKYGL